MTPVLRRETILSVAGDFGALREVMIFRSPYMFGAFLQIGGTATFGLSGKAADFVKDGTV
jgi:hypothetical protein